MKLLWNFIPDLMTASGDAETFLQQTKQAGATGIRIFLLYTWGKGWKFCPFVQVGTWTHPTTGETFPFFDLREFNLDYWVKFKKILRWCKKLDLSVCVSIHDANSTEGNKHFKYFNPFTCSIQADPDHPGTSPGGFFGQALMTYQKKLIRKTVNSLRQVGVRFYIEPMNEFSDLGWPEDSKVPIEWMTKIIDFLKNDPMMAVPRGRIIQSGQFEREVRAQVGFYAMHRILDDKDLKTANIPRQTILSNDGAWKDGQGCADEKNRRGMGFDQARRLAKKVKELDLVGVEFMSRCLWHKDLENADLNDWDACPLQECARELKEG